MSFGPATSIDPPAWGFAGNIPPLLKEELFPAANISVQGGGRHYAAWLDGTDPLFGRIADKYMETMCADFGCQDHWYEADGYFAAGRPPWYESEATHQAHFAAAAATTAAGDPEGPCCCHDSKCLQPAKPDCCSCCPHTPTDPAVVANAKIHATAAYTGLNRTDPEAIWCKCCATRGALFVHPPFSVFAQACATFVSLSLSELSRRLPGLDLGRAVLVRQG